MTDVAAVRAREAEERLKAAEVGEDMDVDEESDMAEDIMGETGEVDMGMEGTVTGAKPAECIDLRDMYGDCDCCLVAVESVLRTSASTGVIVFWCCDWL